MHLTAIVSHTCSCGEKITREFNKGNSHSSFVLCNRLNKDERIVKCKCGKEYDLQIDCTVTATSLVPNREFIGCVYRFGDMKKIIYEEDLTHLIENPDQYEFISDRPHGDGDFSYTCNKSFCRCKN